VVVNDDARA